MTPGPLFRIASVLALALVLGSCGLVGNKKRPPPCPKVFLPDETSRLVAFRDGPGRDLTDVKFTAEIMGFSGHCSYDDDNLLTVDLTVDFEVRRGTANTTNKAAFSYFVAIPKLYPSPRGKGVFPIEVPFEDKARRLVYRDEVTLELPLKLPYDGPEHEIYLGFQLTPEQLDYNRRAQRR